MVRYLYDSAFGFIVHICLALPSTEGWCAKNYHDRLLNQVQLASAIAVNLPSDGQFVTFDTNRQQRSAGTLGMAPKGNFNGLPSIKVVA